eukprot:860767-Prymnesium_polylepis.1
MNVQERQSDVDRAYFYVASRERTSLTMVGGGDGGADGGGGKGTGFCGGDGDDGCWTRGDEGGVCGGAGPCGGRGGDAGGRGIAGGDGGDGGGDRGTWGTIGGNGGGEVASAHGPVPASPHRHRGHRWLDRTESGARCTAPVSTGPTRSSGR